MKSLNVSSLNEGDTERSVLAQVALAATYLILAVLATVGNVCVFIINFRWRGGLSKFKITSIFLLNLALTDIGISVLNLPFAFVSICLNRWVFGEIFCVINGFIALYLPVVSIMTVFLITVHRSLVVLYPFKKIITKQIAFILCGVCWIWVLLVPIPPLFGISHYEFSPQRGFCRVAFIQTGNTTKGRLGNLYSVISVTIFVIVPLFVISILNIILLFTSWKLQLSMPVPVYSQSRESTRRKSTLLGDQKAFRTVSLVVGAFIMCWLPQVFITFIGIGGKNPGFPPNSLATFQALLVMANSTMNPFIYTYVNKDFRSRFVQILLCRITGNKGVRTNGSTANNESTDNCHNHNYQRQSLRSNHLLPTTKPDSSYTELNSPIVEDDNNSIR